MLSSLAVASAAWVGNFSIDTKGGGVSVGLAFLTYVPVTTLAVGFLLATVMWMESIAAVGCFCSSPV